MKSNVLEIPIQKEITAYLNVAYPLGFILSEPTLKPWYYEHFINIYSQNWYGNFFRIDYIDSSRFYGDILERQSFKIDEMKGINIIDFIIEYIDKGFALNIFTVDEYYLPQMNAYMHRHFIHEILVYGYDNEEKKLFVTGYNKAGVYMNFTYDYDTFITAYSEALANPPGYLADSLQTIRLRGFFQEYPFDIMRFVNELRNFIFSIPDSKKVFFSLASKDPVTYGYNVYESMIKHMENLIKGDRRVTVNYTAIHFMGEHRKVLCERFNYIRDLFKVSDQFAELVKKYSQVRKEFEAIRMRYLKVLLEESKVIYVREVKNPEELSSILNKIIHANEKEKYLLAEIYEQLNKAFQV